MTDSSDAFLTDGISFGIPNTNAINVEQLDNVMFLDSNGELHFRDNFVKNLVDINGNPVKTITLRDLYTKTNGVYAVNGKLYFKDSSVARPYSLKEVVGAYVDWKNRLTTGGIFWVGSLKLTEINCNNLKVNPEGNPNFGINTTGISGSGRVYDKSSGDYPQNSTGTLVFSFDEFTNNEFTTDDGGNYRLNVDGSWRWHDVPNLKLLIPPVDENKTLMIIAKTSVRLVKSGTPLVLRLFDKTNGEELDRKAVANDSELPVEQQPILSYIGSLKTVKNVLEQLDCQCPTEDQKVGIVEEPPHEIVVQFHVNDQFLDEPEFYVYNTTVENVSGSLYKIVNDENSIRFHPFERRLIGIPNTISEDPLVNSSIDVIIFDTNKADNFGRKTGTELMKAQEIKEVKFDKPFSSSDYSISLSCDKNINIWHSNKKATGFTIRAEKKFTGSIDWVATKQIFEGEG